MKRALFIVVAMLMFGAASSGVLQAQEAAVEAACADLYARSVQQGEIDAAYRCRLRDRGRLERRIENAFERCSRSDQAYLRDQINRFGERVEGCIAAKLRAARQAAGIRQGDVVGSGRRPPRALVPGEDGTSAASSGRTTSGERIKDLLAEAPGGGGRSQGESDPPSARARDLTFRSGLVWSYGGAIKGMHCVQWREPSDPHNWDDNFLCTERDMGLQWSFRGPILGRGLKCIQVREKSDPHDWHDNYFCWPRDLKVTFRFSATGRIEGYRCVAIVEPSDPHTWQDNYLCHREAG